MLSPALFRAKNLKWLALLVFLFFVNCFVIWLWICFLSLRHQRSLIYLGYLPLNSRQTCTLPKGLALSNMVRSFIFPSSDGTLLHSHFYLAPSPTGPAPTILYFHGTGGNIGHRVHYAQSLSGLANCNLLLVNCRGWGLSQGDANRQGIMLDSAAALRFLRESDDLRPHVDTSKLFVLGQSMGGAITIDLVSRFPGQIAGMIVENTFTDMGALVQHTVPMLGKVAKFMTEDWDSAGSLRNLMAAPTSTPMPAMLFLSGAKDELLGTTHMRQLYDTVAPHHPNLARLVTFPEGYHVHTYREPLYFDHIAQFIDQVCGQQ